MIGNRIPRFLLYATALGAAVAIVMLTLFYGQYRWLAAEIVAASYEEHRELLQASYEGGSNSAMQMVEGLTEEEDLFRVAQELPEPSDLLESEDDAPIIRLINAVLAQAVRENASDIHIEPFENRLVVRFRIDGTLVERPIDRRLGRLVEDVGRPVVAVDAVHGTHFHGSQFFFGQVGLFIHVNRGVAGLQVDVAHPGQLLAGLVRGNVFDFDVGAQVW